MIVKDKTFVHRTRFGTTRVEIMRMQLGPREDARERAVSKEG